MVEHVLGQAGMLGQADEDHEPAAVHGGQTPTSITGSQEPSARTATTIDEVDRQPDARDAEDLRPLHLRHEGLLLLRQPAEGVQHDVLDRDERLLIAKKLSSDAGDVRRAHRGDLRVAADDDRVGVVARVAPAPDVGSRMIMKQASW